jgi:hypothetical protein
MSRQLHFRFTLGKVSMPDRAYEPIYVMVSRMERLRMT